MTRGRALGPGRLWKRGPNWILDFRTADGRRERRVLGTDKRVAERRRLDLIARRDMELDGLGSREGQALPVREVLDLYLADLRPRVTPRHYVNVSARLVWVVEQLDGKRVRDVRPMDLAAIRNDLVRCGRSHRTANLAIDRVRAMFTWAERNEIIARSPMRHLDRLPESEDHKAYRRRALTEDEIRRFVAASEADDEECALLWDYARVPQTPLWVALLETGARYGEIRQATWGDVDLGRGTLVLRAENTKSRKQRVIPLRRSLVDRLRALRVMHEAVHGRLPNVSDHVFLSPEGCPYRRPSTSVNRILRRVLDRAGIARVDAQGRKIDVHALRHCFASRLARNGVGLFQAQKLLGHSDPKLTSAVYTHVDAEDLRPAVDALPEVQRAQAAQAKEAK